MRKRLHLRLLPMALFAGALLLTVKAGHLWGDLSVTAGASSAAETAPAAEGSAPAQADAAGATSSPEATAAEGATDGEMDVAEAAIGTSGGLGSARDARRGFRARERAGHGACSG
jgi:hypothetical protein